LTLAVLLFRRLEFDLDRTNWWQLHACNGEEPDGGTPDGDDDGVGDDANLHLDECCIWFGKTYGTYVPNVAFYRKRIVPTLVTSNGVLAGAPLERIGKCETTNYVDFPPLPKALFLSYNGITAIPTHAFKACGKPE
jgi:hypothetical protein